MNAKVMGWRSVMFVAGLVACAGLGACRKTAETALLERFFDASRLRDLTALADFATVVFEPLRDGIVTQFEVVSVQPESRVSFDASSADSAELAAIATLSADPINPENPHKPIRRLARKDIVIDALVRTSDGTTMRRLTVSLQRAVSDRGVGRWVVTAVR
jgi:hypothetical protein